MKAHFFLLFASIAFALDQLAGLVFPGYLWLLPMVLVYYVVAEEQIFLLVPIVIMTDLFSGLPFGITTLVLAIVGATIALLKYGLQMNFSSLMVRVVVTLLASAEFFLIIKYVFI